MVLLHGIFRFAVRRGWATATRRPRPSGSPSSAEPSSRCSPPSRCRQSRGQPTTEQDAALILVAAFTGLRLGELRGLRWRDVDFANQLVHVRRSHYGAATPRRARRSQGRRGRCR